MPSPLQTQINVLGERMDKGFDELKGMIRSFDERVRAVENREAGCRPAVDARLGELANRLDGHEETLKAHTEAIQALQKIATEMAQTNLILKWVLGVVTAIIGAVLIALLTGQATLVFR